MRTDDWKQIHQRLAELARTQAMQDYEIGRWLLAAQRVRVDRRLGFASLLEYGERLFGQNRRMISERLRVARALEEAPALAAALRGSELSWSTVRELTRVATRDTEREWLEAARGKTVREVEAMVSGRQPGDRPGDPAREEAQRHVLRFEVSAETLALVREALSRTARDAGEHLSDDEALALIARQVLGGPADVGRAGYQIAVCLCPSCGQATQQGSGTDVVIGLAATEMAACDSQVIDLGAAPHGAATAPDVTGSAPHGAGAETHVGTEAASNVAAPAPAVAVAAETHVRAPEVAIAAQTHVSSPEVAVANETHVGARARATQSIPPAVRRRVLRRDHGRCVVPGCRHTIVDCHHLRRRADGGGHDEENVCALCNAHHARVHQGTLIIEGRPSTGLRFSHADGTPYGGAVAPEVADAFAEAFCALVTLGFREGEARRALEAARTHVGEDPSTEQVVRVALGALRRVA